MLADDMGIHYYDKELIKLASEDSGINERLFVNADEKIKMTNLFKVVKKVYTCNGNDYFLLHTLYLLLLLEWQLLLS